MPRVSLYPMDATCATCGAPFIQRRGNHLNCSVQCMRSWVAQCRQPVSCKNCGVPFAPARPEQSCCGKLCASAVGVSVRVMRAHKTTRPGVLKRREREKCAPGLPISQRRRLLQKWLRQRRSCTYCPARATAIDHLIPLSRGGTHGEGNLAPCCKRCNSSKNDRLVSEWRAARARALESAAP